MKIGYIPYTNQLTHPADRRRIKIWAEVSGNEIEIFNPLTADVLLLSNAANFGYWIKKTNLPIILDLVDGYIGEDASFLKDMIRNIVRTVNGKSSLKWITYTNHLKYAIKNANFIIVPCPEQRNQIIQINRNVEIILDDHTELKTINLNNPITDCNFACDKHKAHILWEGFGFTLKHLKQISHVLDEYLDANNIGMYIVTNRQFKKWGNSFGNTHSRKIIESIFPKSAKHCHLIDWTVENLFLAAQLSDLGIIPILDGDKFGYLKSENKMLSMWTLGLQVLCSPNPAYSRVAQKAGIDAICKSNDEWLQKINMIVESGESNEITRKIEDYLLKNHNHQFLLNAWIRVINKASKITTSTSDSTE